jgi:hypothetical protein
VKTNTELRNAKNDLTITNNKLEGILNYLPYYDLAKTAFKMLCAGTKKELEKTKANVNNLSSQLNGIQNNFYSCNLQSLNALKYSI